MTTKLYKNIDNTTISGPRKWKSEGKAAVDQEGMVAKKQEQTTTKQQAIQKIHTNKVHTEIGSQWEDSITPDTNQLHFRINRMI